MSNTVKLLGVSGSLRNLRHGKGSDILVEEINQIHTREHLIEYLSSQAQICLSSFIEAGRKDNKSFDKILKNLKRLPGVNGLSNSEVLLVACLWAAKQNNVEIEHVSLSDIFGNEKNAKEKIYSFLNKIKEANGILVSGPVYFGDRGSLTHDFLQLLRVNSKLVKDKVFAGITVGAKRNGGQETTLIYQMLDFINIGMLAVGNDAESTAQYGGTGHAGDVGDIAKDYYGINTAIGTGNRISNVLKMINSTKDTALKKKPKIGIIVLQDKNNKVLNYVKKTIINSYLSKVADFRLLYLVNESIKSCIACDICPTEVDDDRIYRCIIKSKKDVFSSIHEEMIDFDAILIGGFSPENYESLKSVYQKFMERTRYLRRSDYLLSNYLVVPLIFKDVNSRENLETRIITSMIRHHTIIYSPIIFNELDNRLINFEKAIGDLEQFVEMAKKIAVGRIKYNATALEYEHYNPVGYTLSSAKDKDFTTIQKRKTAMNKRRVRFKQMLTRRVIYNG